MMNTSSWTRRLVPVALLAVVLTAWPVSADDLAPPLRFRSFMVNMFNGRSGTIDVVVSNWSPASAAEQLAKAIDDNGADAAVGVLDKLHKVGYLQVPGYLGLDVQYTRVTPGPEKSQEILVVAKRLMRFGEMVNNTLSTDYPLTVVELQIKADGSGTGMLYPIARINYFDLKRQLAMVDSLTQGINLPTVTMAKEKK